MQVCVRKGQFSSCALYPEHHYILSESIKNILVFNGDIRELVDSLCRDGTDMAIQM